MNTATPAETAFKAPECFVCGKSRAEHTEAHQFVFKYFTRYKTSVFKNGKSIPIGSGFVDWFADDETAKTELARIMAEQGYKVASVEIKDGAASVHLS